MDEVTPWVLLTLHHPSHPSVGSWFVQRLLYILHRAYPAQIPITDWRPSHYGPWSATVSTTIETATDAGLLNKRDSKGFYITLGVPGYLQALELVKEPSTPKTYLRTLVDWALPLGLIQISAKIRSRFPDWEIYPPPVDAQEALESTLPAVPDFQIRTAGPSPSQGL